MTRIIRLLDTSTTVLGPNRVEAIAGTSRKARDGHVIDMRGMDTAAFLRSGTILYGHDSDQPCATPVSGRVDSAGNLRLVIDFAPDGASARADEIKRLVKAGVVRNMSIGFEPIEMEPLNPGKPRTGMHITRSELLECSFVAVPADTGAVVTARSAAGQDWTVGAAIDLPIEDSDAWDGAAAAESIFKWAGTGAVSGGAVYGAKACRGFLVYDASAPELRGSYKLPIAHVVRGELRVPKGAIRAAASRLPQTDIPDEVKERARAVLEHYKERAGIGDGVSHGARRPTTRAGKVLSGENAEALRTAHDLAERCRGTIADVLAGAGEGPDDDVAERARRRRDATFDRRQRQAEALELAGKAHLLGDATFDRRQRQAEALRLGAGG